MRFERRAELHPQIGKSCSPSIERGNNSRSALPAQQSNDPPEGWPIRLWFWWITRAPLERLALALGLLWALFVWMVFPA